ncbi:MAG: molybdopterin molybdenumtransferase MoeA [Chloroflexi bacterium B3_Chlor]|nr:MAG: molybdopterin molybdenumtransferase MoeA [Chloroflexi bacterium B3_Chlor]
MIPVDEALRLILDHVQPLEPERVHILEGLGRVLAEDIYSDVDIPPFDNSAMDGYAIQAADTQGATTEDPARLRVVANLAAGHTTDVVVEPGTAIRIMTGAPLAAGADTVVRFEETSEYRTGKWELGEQVELYNEVRLGANVRPRGEDIRRGELVLNKGTLLRAQEIGVLASLGRPQCLVTKRPRVAILATGDELVGVEEEVGPGQIRSSNEYSNAALVQKYGGIPVRLGIARDEVQELRSKIEEGLAAGVDLFLTSAGVSVGDYDIVKDVLGAEGKMHFWQVKMKPGKPLAFGEIRGVPLIGLPGNPVSAMVSFEQFVRPAMLKMLGRSSWEMPTVKVIVDHDIDSGKRRDFLRAVVEHRDDGYHAQVVRGPRGSGVLTSMVRANALLVVPEGVDRVKAGDRLEAQMLDWHWG